MSEVQQRSVAVGRVRWARLLARENGVRWTAYAAILSGLKFASRFVEGRQARLEARDGISGRNAVRVNYAYWQQWNWSRQGEEWTISEEWKQSLIDDVMLRYIRPGTTVLEIGPGGGRWTAALQPLAAHLTIVDLSDRCIDICRRRFTGATNMEFRVNDGRSLPFASDESIDAVWSFDVFVHIAPPEIQSYLHEIARVLRAGGRAVIHHAAVQGGEAQQVGLRSPMTADMFAAMARSAGLTVREQFDSWGPDGRFKVPKPWDVVTVVEKPI